jgi:hypothetical protein
VKGRFVVVAIVVAIVIFVIDLNLVLAWAVFFFSPLVLTNQVVGVLVGIVRYVLDVQHDGGFGQCQSIKYDII